MESWNTYYISHITTAEEAVKRIKSGDRVVIQHACGEPTFLVNAMVANAEAYRDVEIVHMVAMGQAAYAQPGMEPYFRHNALFVGGSTQLLWRRDGATLPPASFLKCPACSSLPFRWM